MIVDMNDKYWGGGLSKSFSSVGRFGQT